MPELSRSSKTTLLSLIGSLRSAPSSSLNVPGQELCGASKTQMVALRPNIGYIFQAHNLLKFLTAKQTVQMLLELHDLATAHTKADAMLAAVGLEERSSYYPELSGRQKQRMAIARALVS